MRQAENISAQILGGRRILVVEDNFYLADDATRALRAAGAEIVGPVPRSAQAMDAVTRADLDAAVVDINLGEGPSFALADALEVRGVPFIFVTGYDEVVIPPRHAAAALVRKPAEMRSLIDAVAGLLS